jgi:hypothetical protein
MPDDSVVIVMFLNYKNLINAWTQNFVYVTGVPARSGAVSDIVFLANTVIQL